MNQEKAREFFSAYYEETLEGGLRQTFEQRLKTDATLQAEYRAFETTMNDLCEMKLEEIEIPAFLSDRIATRLEEVQAKKRTSTPVWATWFRGLAFSGLAAAAIIGAIVSMRGGNNEPSMGNLGGMPASDQITFKLTKGSEVQLRYTPSAKKTLDIVVDGKTEHRDVDTHGMVSTLENKNAEAALFTVQVEGEKSSAIIAVPGTRAGVDKAGQGKMSDFVKALAGFYKTPVLVNVANMDASVTWSFESTDATDAANKALVGQGISVDLKTDGFLNISDH